MNLSQLRTFLRDIMMSEAKEMECSRSAVAHKPFAGHKDGAAESVNFPPVISIVRPYDGLSQ